MVSDKRAQKWHSINKLFSFWERSKNLYNKQISKSYELIINKCLYYTAKKKYSPKMSMNRLIDKFLLEAILDPKAIE